MVAAKMRTWILPMCDDPERKGRGKFMVNTFLHLYPNGDVVFVAPFGNTDPPDAAGRCPQGKPQDPGPPPYVYHGHLDDDGDVEWEDDEPDVSAMDIIDWQISNLDRGHELTEVPE